MRMPFFKPNDDALVHRAVPNSVQEATPPKAVAIFGPRRIGKTTLLEQITRGQPTSWYTGDFPSTEDALRFQTSADAVNALTAAPNLVIDEAHKIPDIGNIVKMLVDTNERLHNPSRIFLTRSLALNLQTVRESAVGRVTSRRMWLFSLYELAGKFDWGLCQRLCRAVSCVRAHACGCA